MRKSLVVLLLVLLIFIGYGILSFFNPYILSKTETVHGFDTWIDGNTQEAYFYFKLTSDAFISTNYPVTVHVKVVIFNPDLIPIINSKQHQVISITNSEYYPQSYSSLNGLPNTGQIELKFDGDRTYEGERILLFPYLGDVYRYTFDTRDVDGSIVEDYLLIYAENRTSPKSSATPPIIIQESYSARASYEQANQTNGISFAALGVAGIALVAYYHFEVEKNKVHR